MATQTGSMDLRQAKGAYESAGADIDVVEQNASDAVRLLSENMTEQIDAITSMITNDDTGLRARIESLAGSLASLDSEYKLNWEDLSSFIKFKDENDAPNLVLGNENSDYNVVVTNTALVFRKLTAPIAYMNGSELYVENSLSFGNFMFYQRQNGHFSLKYIGGGD